MEAQALQQPTTTSYARPQRPTDPSAAALPTKTLIQIFELAMDEQDIFERQTTRIQLGKVCYSWREIARGSREYGVKNSSQAARLADSLLETDRGGLVRSLVFIAGDAGKPFTPSGGMSLVQACHGVESLDLKLGERGSFGDGFVGALGGLQQLREFSLSQSDRFRSTDLHSLLQKWPKLQSLKLKVKLTPIQNLWDPPPTSTLQHLDVVVDPKLHHPLSNVLRGVDSLRSLRVRAHVSQYLPQIRSVLRVPDEDAATTLAPFAQQLRSLSAPDGWPPSNAFQRLLETMPDLELLQFGVGPHVHPTIPSRSLPKLREFVVNDCGQVALPTSLRGNLLGVLKAPPPKLSLLSMPSSLLATWTDEQRLQAERTAEAAEIALAFI